MFVLVKSYNNPDATNIGLLFLGLHSYGDIQNLNALLLHLKDPLSSL